MQSGKADGSGRAEISGRPVKKRASGRRGGVYEWYQIEQILPEKTSQSGRTGKSGRKCVSGNARIYDESKVGRSVQTGG